MTQKAAKSARAGRVSDSYLSCVRRFPLKPIRSMADYREGVDFLGRLASREDLDAGEHDYVAALSMFVGDFEAQHGKLKLEAMEPLDALRFLMEQNDMNTTDLGRIVGSRGLASEILHGKRGLSKTTIHRLAERFAVEPSLFL